MITVVAVAGVVVGGWVGGEEGGKQKKVVNALSAAFGADGAPQSSIHATERGARLESVEGLGRPLGHQLLDADVQSAQSG